MSLSFMNFAIKYNTKHHPIYVFGIQIRHLNYILIYTFPNYKNNYSLTNIEVLILIIVLKFVHLKIWCIS